MLPSYHRISTPPELTVAETPNSFLDDYQSSQNATPLFAPTRSAFQDVRYSHPFAPTVPADLNDPPYNQYNLAESFPQQNINAASQAGYYPEFENQIINQPEYRVAFAIILRDAIAIVSQLYEEGERSLPHGEMQQLLTEIEDEVHFRLQPHGRNNMESETPVTATTSTSSAPEHEDRISVDHQPLYEYQSLLNDDDGTHQFLQRNAGDIPLHSTNHSVSLNSDPPSAPYYRAINSLSLQVPNRWAASPGHDSAYVSTRSAPLDKPGSSTPSYPFDHASERSLHSLHPESDFHPRFPFPAENQPYPEVQLYPEPPPFWEPCLHSSSNAAQAMSFENEGMDECVVSD